MKIEPSDPCCLLHFRNLWKAGFAASALFGAVVSTQAGPARQITTAAATSAAPSWLQTSRQATVREQLVHVDLDELTRIARVSTTQAQESFALDVFGESLLVRVERSLAAGPAQYVIHGRVAAREASGSVTIAIVNGVAQGSITTPDGRHFSIRYAGDAYQIAELDVRRAVACGNERDSSRRDRFSKSGAASLNAAFLDPSFPVGDESLRPQIDVMLVYTPAMRTAAGGEDAMRALCDLAIAETNQSFLDSGISVEARLVHAQEVNYTEVDTGIDLGRLTERSDGFLDEVHALRDQYAADVVHLFLASSTDGFGGRAFIASSADTAFGVNVGIWPFRHELGHNLGCHHDRPNAGEGGATFSYGYGYSFTGTNGQIYGDLMSYVGQYTGLFSTPRVTHQGKPAGVLKSVPNSADNATAINNSAAFVAAFRGPDQPSSTAPKLNAGTPAFDFPRQEIRAGETNRYWNVANHGGTPLQFTDIHLSGEAEEFGFSVYDYASQTWLQQPEQFALQPGFTAAFSVFYRPIRSYAEAKAALVFKTNDPSSAAAAVELPVTAAAGPQLRNISSRLVVKTGDDVLIGGFIVSGSVPRRIAIRAIGPSLGQAGLSGVLADPVLELHGDAGLLASNDDWESGLARGTADGWGLAPADDLESVIIKTLPPGSYTAVVRGYLDGTGIGLIEAYNLDADTGSEMLNISTRGRVEQGDQVMIGGFILGGSAYSEVVARGIGPSLAAAGVAGALQDPLLELRDPQGNLLIGNDNWRTQQGEELIATKLAPVDEREAAVLATLAPGGYTVVIRGASATSGVGMVEVFKLSPRLDVLASNLHFNTLFPSSNTPPAQGFALGKILSDDPDRLFWFEYNESHGARGGSIKSMAKAGGVVTTLASRLAAVNGLVSHGDFLYWSETAASGAGFIKRMAKDGTQRSVIASGTPKHEDGSFGRPVSKVAALCADASAVYWIQDEAYPPVIRKVPKAGGPIVDVLSGDINPVSLVCDASYLYFGEANGTINRASKLTAAKTVLASGSYNWAEAGLPKLALDATSLYFLDAVSISVVPKSGGAVRNLTNVITPHDFALDGRSVYYQSGGRVYRVAKAGGLSKQLIPYSREGGNPFRVAVDAEKLYYGNVGRQRGNGALIMADKERFGQALDPAE